MLSQKTETKNITNRLIRLPKIKPSAAKSLNFKCRWKNGGKCFLGFSCYSNINLGKICQKSNESLIECQNASAISAVT